MKSKTIKLTSNISEGLFIENLINQYHSGYSYEIYLALHAMANGWKIDKVIYYRNLIEGSK